MNKIHKKVWNKLRGCFVAVSEAMGSGQSRGKTVSTALAVISTLAVALPAHADTSLYNWNHYTGTNDWSNDINAANYGNDSTDVTMTGTRVYDRIAIGRRSGSHIYGGKTPCEDSKTGYCAVAPGYLTDGANLTLQEGSKITVSSNMWLFGTVFIDRTAADDGDGRDDVGGFGQDLTLLRNASLLVKGTLDVGTYNGGSSNWTLYGDWNEVQLSSGASIEAGTITGVAKFTLDNATIVSAGTLGTKGYLYAYGNKDYNGSPEPYSRYFVKNNSLLKTHTLDSNVILEIANSTLQADIVSLSRPTVTGNESTFQTTLDAVATITTQSKTVDAIGLDGTGNYSLDGSSLGTTESFGGFDKTFTDNVSWTDGTFVFDGTYTESVVNAAKNAIEETFGDSNEVIFGSVVEDAPELGDGLTTEQINVLLADNGNPERVLHTTVWDQQNQANSVTISSSDSSIGVSIGFKNLKNDVSTTVNEGRTLVLLGDGTASAVAEGSLIADGGILQLGVNGVTSGGTVKEVSLANSGALNIASGNFYLESVTGTGTVNIGQDAIANINSHVVDGSFVNDGTLKISGDLSFADNSTLTSSGLLETNLDNIFENVTPAVVNPLKVIGLNASLPEEVRSVATELFQKYVPGDVASDLAEHAVFSGGKVTITGVNLTETQVADLTQAFKEQLYKRF